MKNQFTVLPEVAKYLEEARLLTGEALATSLTNTTLAFWHDLVSKFVNAPSEHDIHQHGVDGNFLCLKMTPGADVIESVYDRVIDRADDLTKALNDKFGKKVFQTKLSRDGGELSVLVAFVESDGGVFQCKSEAEGGSYAVALRCPNGEQLKIAFSAMAQVPTPDADMDGDIDANDAPELEDAQQYDEEVEQIDEIHDRYMRAHGKKASGKSMYWMFTTKRSGDPKGDIYRHKGNDTVSAAATAARKHFGTNDVYVMEDVQQYDEGMATESTSNTQDYVNHLLSKALRQAGISCKVVKKIGQTTYYCDNGYVIVNDGVGITVMKNSEEEVYIGQPRLNYRKAVELVSTEVQQEAKEDEIDSEDMDPSLAPEMEVDPDYELPQNIVINDEFELSAEDQDLYDLAKKVYHQAETGSDLEKLSYGIMAHLKSMIVAGKSMNTEARKKAELLLGRLCNEEVAGTSVAGAIAGGQSPAPAVVADAGPRKKTKHKFVTLQRHGMSGGPFS